jgi:hypothetical protein
MAALVSSATGGGGGDQSASELATLLPVPELAALVTNASFFYEKTMRRKKSCTAREK